MFKLSDPGRGLLEQTYALRFRLKFASVIILVVIKNSGFVHFFLYTAIGLISSIVLGYIISKLIYKKQCF